MHCISIRHCHLDIRHLQIGSHMFDIHHLTRGLFYNWPIWIVTLTLIVAAVIDGLKLKVPNWITFPMIISGWVYSVALSPYAGWEGLMYSVLGTVVGLALLLPAYAIGGMGAGDVKLLAGVGAWVWATHTMYAFGVSAVVGALLAVGMVLARKGWQKHNAPFWVLLHAIMGIRNPEQLVA